MNTNVKRVLQFIGLAILNALNHLFGKPEDKNIVAEYAQKLYVSA